MNARIKILILEHDPNDLGLLQYELKKSGLTYTTEIVQTRSDFEQTVTSFRPDIVLSDFSLPSFNGLEAFTILQKTCPETPFIIVSGTIGDENAVDLIKMGVTDYVLKEKMYQIAPKILRALKEAADKRHKKTAELQLRQSEEQLQKILNLSLDVIYTVDSQGKFVTVSPAAKLVLDYLPEELAGKKIIDFVHEEYQEEAYEAINNLRNGVDIINREDQYVRKTGTPITLLWSARWDAEENLGYGVAKDITNYKKAEEKIKNNAKRFKTLLQNSTDGLTLLSEDGVVLERSPNALKVLGLGEEEVSGKFRTDRVHPDDLRVLNTTCRKVKSKPNEIITIEYRFLMPDNTYKWLETTFHNQLKEPAVEAIVLNFKDITERKLAEQTLQKSEARLKEAQALGHIGNWELNWLTGEIEWSDEMFRMFGLEKGKVKPSTDLFFSFVHPQDRETVLSVWKNMKRLKENQTYSFRILLKNGQVKFIHSESFFEFDSQHNPIRFFGIQQDVTEMRQAELALEKSEEKYRGLFNLSPVPMWVYDVETRHFLNVNEAAVRHYGYSEEDFLSMTLEEIQPNEEHLALSKTEKDIPKGVEAHFNGVFRHIKKNGEIIKVDIKSSLIEIGHKEARLVIASDISERINYINAIEEHNARLKEIAWIQSHVVRAPLARMMGLVNMLHPVPYNNVNTSDILKYILDSAHELDGIIREIVEKTESINAPLA